MSPGDFAKVSTDGDLAIRCTVCQSTATDGDLARSTSVAVDWHTVQRIARTFSRDEQSSWFQQSCILAQSEMHISAQQPEPSAYTVNVLLQMLQDYVHTHPDIANAANRKQLRRCAQARLTIHAKTSKGIVVTLMLMPAGGQ